MARNKKVVIEFEADTSDVNKSVEDLGGNVDVASSKIDSMTGGLVSGFQKGIAGVKGMVVGMKTLRGAIMLNGS